MGSDGKKRSGSGRKRTKPVNKDLYQCMCNTGASSIMEHGNTDLKKSRDHAVLSNFVETPSPSGSEWPQVQIKRSCVRVLI